MQKITVSPVKVDKQPGTPNYSLWDLTQAEDLLDLYRILRNIDKYVSTEFAAQVRAAVSEFDTAARHEAWNMSCQLYRSDSDSDSDSEL